MKESIKSDLTGKIYYPSDCLRLVNVPQLVFYMKHNVNILDIYTGKDLKTGKDILVYIVNPKEKRTQEVYRKWLETRNETNNSDD